MIIKPGIDETASYVTPIIINRNYTLMQPLCLADTPSNSISENIIAREFKQAVIK